MPRIELQNLLFSATNERAGRVLATPHPALTTAKGYFAMALPKLCSIEGCGKAVFAANLCCSHYKRKRRYGDPLAGRAHNGECYHWLTEHAGFVGRECLIWPFGSAGDERPYGYATWPDGKQESSARIMCALAHGPQPADRPLVRHLCGKGRSGCVNPQHLAWGTYKQNCDDMVLHGTRLVGERVNGAKLTIAEVAMIRELKGKQTQRVTARRFGVTQAAVSMIQNGQRWPCPK